MVSPKMKLSPRGNPMVLENIHGQTVWVEKYPTRTAQGAFRQPFGRLKNVHTRPQQRGEPSAGVPRPISTETEPLEGAPTGGKP